MAVWKKSAADKGPEDELIPQLTRAALSNVPKERIAASEMLPDTAYEIVADEIMLDGNARFNLATFVSTYMLEHADKLYAKTYDKNMIDKDEYPQTAEIENRCVQMLANLWHAPDAEESIGTSTTGSSEAAMLGGMALKRRWQASRRAAGKSTDKPNIVMGGNVQVCWEKFANYWEVEPRLVPLDEDHLFLTPERMMPFVDENTIGVVAIMGSTMDGSYEPVAEICAALDEFEAKTGIHVPVHVDGASGGFIAPFVQPELLWDFRLERVASINSSGHKYGLVYPGVGWVVWRSKDLLPEELIFNVNYLGGEMPTFALNFSRPGAQIVLQYYVFLRLGMDGFRRVQGTSIDVAMALAKKIEAMPEFDLISDGSDIPVFAFALAPSVTKYTVYDVSRSLRERGWLVPAYTMPPNREDLAVLRLVIRHGFSHDMGDLFLKDLKAAVTWLDNLSGPMPVEEKPAGFHH